MWDNERVIFHLQKKGSLLEIMLDKLRQENSEEALKSTLDKIKGFLEELNGG